MGGCYGSSYSYRDDSSSRRSYAPVADYEETLASFRKTKKLETLVQAYREFMNNNSSGFFTAFAKSAGIGNVAEIPKEFDGMEYEVKFDVAVEGRGKEPGINDYLDAFDFPPARTARFLKDPVNSIATGVNSFIGDGLDEKLVVIEKGGRLYLKEKGPVVPISAGVDYQQIVMKRAEQRYETTVEEMISKVAEVSRQAGVEYKGKVRKEKGDVFILDTNDGRLYGFTISRAHLVKPGSSSESDIQRQLEIEYAGHIPGFKGFENESEQQMVQGMVDLARYTYAMYSNSPITDGWRMMLRPTDQRKYDFIAGKRNGELPAAEKAPFMLVGEKDNAAI